jgi:predicted RNA binding protein YcfA (HicA-like mRNA interferase family)
VPLHAQSSNPAEHACDAAEEYVKLINNSKYDSVGGVFADDAVYMGPDGKTRHGSKEIGAFYSRFLPIFKPQLRASRFFAQGNECMMELENKNQSGEFAPTRSTTSRLMRREKSPSSLYICGQVQGRARSEAPCRKPVEIDGRSGASANAMKVRELLRLLAQDGWYEVRSRGSHRIFKHPVKPGLVVVAVHGSAEVPSGTLKAILKQAGLEEKK